MSTFYVLPPRPLLARPFLEFLRGVFPDLDTGPVTWGDLAQAVAQLPGTTDVYFVHREDLPEGEVAGRALADGFGAEPGDQVIEVAPSGPARRWFLDAAA